MLPGRGLSGFGFRLMLEGGERFTGGPRGKRKRLRLGFGSAVSSHPSAGRGRGGKRGRLGCRAETNRPGKERRVRGQPGGEGGEVSHSATDF